MELGDGDVEGYGLVVGGGEGYSHLAAGHPPLFARLVDVPGAGHEHVGYQDEVAAEEEEGPLAAGFYFFDGAADQRCVVVDAR